jgi:hypothetical protein
MTSLDKSKVRYGVVFSILFFSFVFKIKPIPIQKSLALVNNFVLNTALFLNTFTETIENKILQTSNKITQLEILLSVLEAKLNSVPGLDSSLPAPSSSSSTSQPNNTASSINSSQHVASNESLAVADPVEQQQPEQQSMEPQIPEEYASYVRMIKVGVPKFVVQAKAAAAGLDPNVLENCN